MCGWSDRACVCVWVLTADDHPLRLSCVSCWQAFVSAPRWHWPDQRQAVSRWKTSSTFKSPKTRSDLWWVTTPQWYPQILCWQQSGRTCRTIMRIVTTSTRAGCRARTVCLITVSRLWQNYRFTSPSRSTEVLPNNCLFNKTAASLSASDYDFWHIGIFCVNCLKRNKN